MRAHLRALLTPDLQPGLLALADFHPEDSEHFGVNVQAFISADPDGPDDSFDFFVCTPRWFADRCETTDLGRSAETNPPLTGSSAGHQLLGNKLHRPTHEMDPVLFGRGLVFILRWDYAKLEADVRELCKRTEGPDWGAVASRLDRLLPWEFNYRYDQAMDKGTPFPPVQP